MTRCHAHPCRAPGHFVGAFQSPFCSEHHAALTPLKQSEVLEIQHFSVLDPNSRPRAIVIINKCRRYLMAAKETRKSA